jgi:hypothetical protein
MIQLEANQLTEVPERIGQLTALRELFLSQNRLVSLPRQVGLLTQLSILCLEQNAIRSVPAELGQLANLELLRLNHNHLTWLPFAIERLPAATKVFLSRLGATTHATSCWTSCCHNNHCDDPGASRCSVHGPAESAAPSSRHAGVSKLDPNVGKVESNCKNQPLSRSFEQLAVARFLSKF